MQADPEGVEDIMKYFLEDYHSEKPKAFFDRNILYTDSQAITVAGTDTVAFVLANTFYYLAKDSRIQAKLREELTPAFGQTIPNEFGDRDLAKVEYLCAVIDESMRMHSAVGNNGARCTPPEGLEIDGTYIPGNVTVFIGIHAMHRSMF